MQRQEKRIVRESLTVAERLVEPVATMFAMALLGGFLLYHQIARTGFFTVRFGPLEMLCVYGPIILSLGAPVARSITGRRNPGRPLDVVSQVCAALAALWLLQVFPFDFTHLADALPGAMRFVFSWVTDGIGMIVLLLQVVVGLVAALFTTIAYLAVSLQTSSFSVHADHRLHPHRSA